MPLTEPETDISTLQTAFSKAQTNPETTQILKLIPMSSLPRIPNKSGGSAEHPDGLSAPTELILVTDDTKAEVFESKEVDEHSEEEGAGYFSSTNDGDASDTEAKIREFCMDEIEESSDSIFSEDASLDNISTLTSNFNNLKEEIDKIKSGKVASGKEGDKYAFDDSSESSDIDLGGALYEVPASQDVMGSQEERESAKTLFDDWSSDDDYEDMQKEDSEDDEDEDDDDDDDDDEEYMDVLEKAEVACRVRASTRGASDQSSDGSEAEFEGASEGDSRAYAEELATFEGLTEDRVKKLKGEFTCKRIDSVLCVQDKNNQSKFIKKIQEKAVDFLTNDNLPAKFLTIPSGNFSCASDACVYDLDGNLKECYRKGKEKTEIDDGRLTRKLTSDHLPDLSKNSRAKEKLAKAGEEFYRASLSSIIASSQASSTPSTSSGVFSPEMECLLQTKVALGFTAPIKESDAPSDKDALELSTKHYDRMNKNLLATLKRSFCTDNPLNAYDSLITEEEDAEIKEIKEDASKDIALRNATLAQIISDKISSSPDCERDEGEEGAYLYSGFGVMKPALFNEVGMNVQCPLWGLNSRVYGVGEFGVEDVSRPGDEKSKEKLLSLLSTIAKRRGKLLAHQATRKPRESFWEHQKQQQHQQKQNELLSTTTSSPAPPPVPSSWQPSLKKKVAASSPSPKTPTPPRTKKNGKPTSSRKPSVLSTVAEPETPTVEDIVEEKGDENGTAKAPSEDSLSPLCTDNVRSPVYNGGILLGFYPILLAVYSPEFESRRNKLVAVQRTKLFQQASKMMEDNVRTINQGLCQKMSIEDKKARIFLKASKMNDLLPAYFGSFKLEEILLGYLLPNRVAQLDLLLEREKALSYYPQKNTSLINMMVNLTDNMYFLRIMFPAQGAGRKYNTTTVKLVPNSAVVFTASSKCLIGRGAVGKEEDNYHVPVYRVNKKGDKFDNSCKKLFIIYTFSIG